jgi:hypothetical protein
MERNSISTQILHCPAWSLRLLQLKDCRWLTLPINEFSLDV